MLIKQNLEKFLHNWEQKLSENKTSARSNNSYAQALFELASENYVLLEIEVQAVAILKLIKD